MNKTTANPGLRLGGSLWLILAATLAVLFLPTSALEAQDSVAAGNPQTGETVYMTVGCYRCHGTVGQGGFGGRLAPNPIAAPLFTAYVRNGKLRPNANPNWSGMPPYSEKFISDSELADIYAYVASIPQPTPVESIPLLSD